MRELIKNCMERINKMKRLRLIAINLMNVAANFLLVSFGQQLASPLTSWPRAHAGCLVACPLGTIRVDGSPVVAPNVRAGTARFRQLSGLLRKTCARRELFSG
jgi:hypothetical protein